MAVTISTEVIRKIERIHSYFSTPTGNTEVDDYHRYMAPMLSSPDSSGIQEQILAEACGATHKGGKKLGDDAIHGEDPMEIKPCKSERPVPCVNITDDQPSRLIKDLQKPNKLLAIGRCPGGIKFRWVVVCPMKDFAESRYKAMCKHCKHEQEPWPETIEEQIKVVERLAEKRTKNNYLRSSQLKFTDIKTVIAFWVHPDVDVTTLKKRSEDEIIRRFSGK